MSDIAKKLVSEAIETHKKMVAEMEIEALSRPSQPPLRQYQRH